MRKILAIAWLTLISLGTIAQSNIPSSIGIVTAFKMNALGINLVFPPGTIQTPVAAELWTTPIATAKKVTTIVPVTQIHGDTVTVKLTAAQVRLIDQLNFYVIFKNTDLVNRKYVIGGIIKTSMAIGIPSATPYIVSLPDIGVIKVNVIGDPSLAANYASIAKAYSDTAKSSVVGIASKIPLTQKAAANGVGTLESDALQPVAQVKPSVIPSANTTGVISTYLKTGTTYYGLKSSFTGNDVIIKQATGKISGGAIADSDVDNIIYFKFSDGNYGIRSFPGGIVNIDEFGAKGDSATDNTSAITKAMSYSKGILINNGTYLISTMIFPSTKTVEFSNGGKLCIKAGQRVKFRSKINAAPDDWIFDCQDTPTNYINQTTSTYTTKPLLLNDSIPMTNNASSVVHLKWFGAKGIGFKSTVNAAYYGSLTVPTTEYVDDTKAIRFAMTAIGESGHQTFHGSPVAGGSNKLMAPKGLFCVSEVVYISSGTFLEGVGSSQSLGTVFTQMNPSKSLFVLQSAGSGGEGGGGSAHNIDNLSISVRPTQSGLGTTNAYLIEFQDNKFNLDSRFNRIRVANIPPGGAAFYCNDKEARYSGLIGTGSTRGLNVTFHIYNSMFDVVQGDVFRTGANGTMDAKVYNSQFYNVTGNVVYSSTKTGANIETLDKLSSFQFFGCNFEGLGTAGSSSFFVDDQYSVLKLLDCQVDSRTIDGTALGAPIQINRAKTFIMRGGVYTTNPTESNGGLYFMLLNGQIDNLMITDVFTRKLTTEPSITTINIGSTFSSSNMNISNNNFYVHPATAIIIYCASTNVSIGKISGNVFHPVAAGNIAIPGNLTPGIIVQDNIFLSPQDVRGIALQNYGMKGRTVTYGYAAPTTGAHYQGDIQINENISTGQPKGWRCTVSGTPGTWVSEGNL